MEDFIDLDDVRVLAEIDPSGMFDAIEGFPEQCEKALAIEPEGSLPAADSIKAVAVLGMGGSGISGDVTRCVLADRMGLPVHVCKSYVIPRFLGPDTLVIAASYSGNTEETLSALAQAQEQGCMIAAITSGGELLRIAREKGYPVAVVPGGMQPRAALGYLALPLGTMLERIGLAPGFREMARAAVADVRERSAAYSRTVPEEKNLAKQLARRLAGRLPVFYGSDGPMAVAAYRWKCQFNEIAKVPAFNHMLPELDHNEIVGFLHLAEVNELTEVIFLIGEVDHPRIEKRARITADLIRDDVAGVSIMHIKGANALESLFGAVALGDAASCYLACLNREDPTPVVRIEGLKRRMADPQED